MNRIYPSSLLFGSPSPDTFVVRWNKSFELVLYNTGALLFKYGDVPADLEDDDSLLVGIGFSAGKTSGSNFYRIDQAPEHHVRKGLVVRYDPLPSCRDRFYKTQFRPKTFRATFFILYIILYQVPPVNNRYKFT
jgi:hypothetical protein